MMEKLIFFRDLNEEFEGYDMFEFHIPEGYCIDDYEDVFDEDGDYMFTEFNLKPV